MACSLGRVAALKVGMVMAAVGLVPPTAIEVEEKKERRWEAGPEAPLVVVAVDSWP